jgi:hypothetical protein
MPKVKNTNLDLLAQKFKDQKTISARAISKMFPNTLPASMVWQLQWRRGMLFEKKIKGKKIVSFTYIAGAKGPKVAGSKKLWEKAQATTH